MDTRRTRMAPYRVLAPTSKGLMDGDLDLRIGACSAASRHLFFKSFLEKGFIGHARAHKTAS